MPRPFGPAIHCTKENDLLKFDYINLGTAENCAQYVLMLLDDYTDLKWFFSFSDTCHSNATTSIIDWCSSFGIPKGLMSDGPTHFKNEAVRLVSKGLKVPHHFTIPYCTWSNGAVVRLGKELVRTCRDILSELQIRPEEWPDVLLIIQSALNNAQSPQRNKI